MLSLDQHPSSGTGSLLREGGARELPSRDAGSPAEEPQKLCSNTALGPGGPLSCVVKEESDVEQGLGEGLVLAGYVVLLPGETRGTVISRPRGN